MSDLLADWQAQIEEVRKANLPQYAQRLENIEIQMRDLLDRLDPLLKLLKTKGE